MGVKDIQALSYSPSKGVPHCFVSLLTMFTFFHTNFLGNYETKNEYAVDSTCFCNLNESKKSSDNPMGFCRQWRLVKNDPLTEMMLFSLQKLANQNRSTKVKKIGNLVYSKQDFENHVDQLKALSMCTWENFQSNFNQASQATSRLQLINF